ncbi:tyrosine-type recombinase/integrase [Bradyrhizobium sp. 164]|uniref:tyrosine-type recombinase/integrase n=1 Tax=Bradyrhizobium sp. 164 TaxID=2782637 RepID=UPI001FFB0C33|nr:tyrosine-type recombinase/integrase [Bradyrhizobium sp. 164]
MGRRDYAILLLLAKLGLRADEVATLALDDIDWRASEMLVRAKGRQRARMPIPPDVGAAIVHICAMAAQSRPAGQARGLRPAHTSTLPATATTFAKTLGKTVTVGEPRATHRRTRRPYKTRVRMPSKLDPHIAAIEAWLAEQPQLTALAIVGRLSEKYPEEFGERQHSMCNVC